jgi:hypothetical protein
MSLLWHDNSDSFLYSSAPDTSGDSFLYSSAPDASGSTTPFTGSFGQSLLWPGGDTSGGGLPGQDILWANPDYGTPIWQLADNAGTAGLTGLGDGTLLSAATIPNDVGSLVWQGTLFGFEEASAFANSSAVDSTLNQILDVVWTATGGTGSPPVTLPHGPSNPFADGLPPFTLPPSQLVWTGQPPLHGTFLDSTGQPPTTPPVGGDSPLTGILPGSMAPQQLVWTDPSQGAPPILDGQQLTGIIPPTLFNRS